MPRRRPDPNPDWRYQLERLMDAYGTQAEVADVLGCTQTAVGKWHTDKAKPSPIYLERLGRIYARLGPGGRVRPSADRAAKRRDIVEQALVVAHQAIDGCREMETIGDVRAHCNRCLVIVSELSTRIQSIDA